MLLLQSMMIAGDAAVLAGVRRDPSGQTRACAINIMNIISSFAWISQFTRLAQLSVHRARAHCESGHGGKE